MYQFELSLSVMVLSAIEQLCHVQFNEDIKMLNKRNQSQLSLTVLRADISDLLRKIAVLKTTFFSKADQLEGGLW